MDPSSPCGEWWRRPWLSRWGNTSFQRWRRRRRLLERRLHEFAPGSRRRQPTAGGAWRRRRQETAVIPDDRGVARSLHAVLRRRCCDVVQLIVVAVADEPLVGRRRRDVDLVVWNRRDGVIISVHVVLLSSLLTSPVVHTKPVLHFITNSTVNPPGSAARAGSCSACFLYTLYLFWTISVRSIISTATESIFTKFSGLVELWLQMNELKLVYRSLKGRYLGNHFFVLSAFIHRTAFAWHSVYDKKCKCCDGRRQTNYMTNSQ